MVPISNVAAATCDAIIVYDSSDLAPLAALAVCFVSASSAAIGVHRRFHGFDPPQRGDFWNFAHEARIRAFLEHETRELD
jgi:hypothetical protein